MSKRPTPKKKRAKRATRMQHSHFVAAEVRRLRDVSSSPYSAPAKPKGGARKAVTRIKA